MSFKAVFKKSFVEGIAASEISSKAILAGLGFAAVLAMYIFFVYRVMTRKTFYSKNFGVALVGVAMTTTALILSVAMTLVILFLDRLPVAKAPMILVVNANTLDAEAMVCQAVSQYAKYYSVKSRNVSAGAVDLVLELRTDKGGDLVKTVSALQSVQSVSLMSHDGEVSF